MRYYLSILCTVAQWPLLHGAPGVWNAADSTVKYHVTLPSQSFQLYRYSTLFKVF